jgi:hypothetical protein
MTSMEREPGKMKRTTPFAGMGRARGLLRIAAIAAALGLFGAGVGSASAAAPRAYDSQMAGFQRPEAVTIGANDEVWVSDTGNGSLLSQFDAFPSQTKIGQQTGSGLWGGLTAVRGHAVSEVNNFLYAATTTCGETNRNFNIFDASGRLYRQVGIEGFPCEGWAAVDNSNSDSRGRVYLYKGQNPSYISVYDGYGNPVKFDGHASYIVGNRITGTANGEFSGSAAGSFEPVYSGISVDFEGNIWVTDEEKKEIDQFGPDGIFIQRITGAGVPTPKGNVFGEFQGLAGVAVDPTNGNILSADRGNDVVNEFSPSGEFLAQMTGADTPAGRFQDPIGVAVNSQGYVYVTDGPNKVVDILKPRPAQPTVAYKPDTNPTTTGGTLNATVDPNGGGNITTCRFDYGPTTAYGSSKACAPDPAGGNFAGPTDVQVDLSGLSTETTYHYRVVVGNANATRAGADRTLTPHAVIGLRADPADVTATSATLHGSFVGNGAPTTYYFEWGRRTSYGHKTAIPPGDDAGSPSGPARTSVPFVLAGLSPATRYHFRIVADNGAVSKSDDQTFRTQSFLPTAKASISDVHSNSVRVNVQVNPGGSDTAYDFEYGTEDCSTVPDPCTVLAPPAVHLGSNFSFAGDSRPLEGLKAGTTYHYRVIATNSAGVAHSPDRTFSTYPFETSLSDSCTNALARQQTGASLMSDCRAYELVSSAHGGGYDVESNLVPDQTPFGGYPLAQNPSKVLYGVHNGAIPDVPGNPTNRGVDPYVATRGDEGWTTSYVGIPADNPNAEKPFSSTLAEADPRLETFAFGGPDICSPCFPDESSGMPLHLPNGSLVQGMLGSSSQPAAKADGLVRKHFSDDGTHFVFSSTSQFESDGNDSNGDVSVYDRNLATGTTQVVSKDPAGANLTCIQGAGTCHSPGNAAGIAGLDISGDGSRIVVGQLISTDSDGNRYYHLYMHVGQDSHTVDLTPGALAGALYDGMSSDGTKVYYSTVDTLVSADTDGSTDIYEAEVGGVGPITPKLISVGAGGLSNDDSCDPPGFPDSWNAVSGPGKCNAVAVGGGAGVVPGTGSVYFMSPELLDSGAEADGEEGEPNLYIAESGESPRFVATVDSSASKPGPPPPNHPLNNPAFLAGLENPESLAVDQSNGDLYVAERGLESVVRYTSGGAPHPFSKGPNAGSNKLTGQALGFGGEGEIAVDNAPGSPFAGALYVTSNGGTVSIYANSGEQLGELSGFTEACGVAVDQSTGAVYVADYGYPAGHIWRFAPTSGSTPVSDANYVKTGIATEELSPCAVGTDTSGHVFAIAYGGALAKEYTVAEFDASAPELPGDEMSVSPVNRIYSDPGNDDLYVDTGEKIVVLNSARESLGEFGMGKLASSQGVAVNAATEHAYASSGEKVLEFGIETLPYVPIDNPLVVDAVHDSGTARTSDFQTTSSGAFAAFPTRERLDPNYDNDGHAEVYRYETGADSLRCASCTPTGAPAGADSSLAANGRSLTDDGRVFFDSDDVLVLRDANSRKDIYEWEEQGSGNCTSSNPNFFSSGICMSLISTGTSPFDSSLLSASADGTDAYFFTHDTLTHEDENGPVAKIYDARANGGAFRIPPPALCAASDECHGPGTEAPPAPSVRTKAGSPGNHRNNAIHCRKGFVKKHGKCVKKKIKKKNNRKRRSHR